MGCGVAQEAESIGSFPCPPDPPPRAPR
jgi:hypothetical protein